MNLNDLTQKLLDLERRVTKDDTRKKRLKGASLCVASIKELSEGLFQVASRRTSDLYQVTLHWCTCADNEFRNGEAIVCAHREAVAAHIKAKKSLPHFEALEALQIAL
jgi:hypothetical protein